MNVATMLKSKGRSVATVRPSSTMSEVAEILSARKIGAIVVVGDQGRVVGIISERDVVRFVAERGASALMLPVGECMTRSVITCTESTTVDELMEIMTSGRFRHVPVVQDEALIGIVSIGDVVKYHVADITLEVTAMRSYLATG